MRMTSMTKTPKKNTKKTTSDFTVLCFKERAGKPGGGKGILIGKDKSFTIATNFNGAICYETKNEQSKMYESVGQREQACV